MLTGLHLIVKKENISKCRHLKLFTVGYSLYGYMMSNRGCGPVMHLTWSEYCMWVSGTVSASFAVGIFCSDVATRTILPSVYERALN